MKTLGQTGSFKLEKSLGQKQSHIKEGQLAFPSAKGGGKNLENSKGSREVGPPLRLSPLSSLPLISMLLL